MLPKLFVPALAVAALGATACGSSNSTSKTTAATKSAGPIRIYRLTLSGAAETPPGAPNGGGEAVIALHGRAVVCWRFAHLHGFTTATFAHIHKGAKGRSGSIVVPLSTGSRLRHKGCVHTSAALVKAIKHSPGSYYVNVHSARYPGGAVRAQL